MKSKKEMRAIIGRNIKALRKKAGLSQIQLAKKVGISQPHLSKVENGIDSLAAEHVPVVIDNLAKPLGLVDHIAEYGFLFRA